MLNTKSFLCLDFGAGSLKIAEFEPNESGTLRLKQFGLKSLGFEGSQDAARERVILKAIQELFAERPFGSDANRSLDFGFADDFNGLAISLHVFPAACAANRWH